MRRRVMGGALRAGQTGACPYRTLAVDRAGVGVDRASSSILIKPCPCASKSPAGRHSFPDRWLASAAAAPCARSIF